MRVPNYDIEYPKFFPAIHGNSWNSFSWKTTYNLFGDPGEYKITGAQGQTSFYNALGKHRSYMNPGYPESPKLHVFREGVTRDTLLDKYIKDPYVCNMPYLSFGTSISFEELCEAYGIKELTLDLYNAYYTACNHGATLKKHHKTYPPLFKKLLYSYLEELSQKSCKEFETYVNDSQHK